MKISIAFIYFFLFFSILSPKTFAALYINEVLPNPSGDDNAKKPGGEWVELFSSGEEVDVLGWVLYDAEDTHKLAITQDNTGGGTVVPANGWLVIYRNGDSDFSLNNTGDEIVRLFNREIGADLVPMSTFSYNGSKEARSWGRVPDGSDSIQQLDPSPGSANMVQLPTPTSSPTPTKILTPTKTLTPTKSPTKTPATPISTQKTLFSIPSVGQTLGTATSYKVNIPTSVLGQSTKSAVATSSSTHAESNKGVKTLGSNQNNIFKILIGAGSIFIFACGILLFRYFKNKEVGNE